MSCQTALMVVKLSRCTGRFCRRLRGSLGATLNREIAFFLASFSFRAWRACEWARRSCECVRGAECSSSRWPQLWEVLLLFAASLRSSGCGVYVGFKAKWVQICTPGRSSCVFYVLVGFMKVLHKTCLLYTSPSPRDKRQSRMPSSA